MRIVLVAGDSPVRTRLAAMLAELPDLHLEVVGSSVDVDQIILQRNPDVVLIDIDQTNGHGLEIIRKLHERSSENTPVIMAIAMSPSLRYRARCLEAGAMYFFNAVREQDWLLESLLSVRVQLGE